MLEIFFTLHDPTQLNRQGPDVGTQYRSVIFYENEDDKSVSKDFMDSISTKYTKPIVTSLEKKTKYYVAEEYHQKYLEKRGLSSCHSGLA